MGSGARMIGHDEASFFRAHGWLIVRGVVTGADVERTAGALDALIPEASYARGYAGKVVEIASISKGSEEIARSATLPIIGRLAAELLETGRIQLLQDTVLVKPPGGGPVEWHQDFSYLGYLDQPRVVTARLALTTCTVESGCLRVIDASHLWGLPDSDLSFRRSSIEDSLAPLSDERRDHARAAETTLELEPGDVSFHHCLTVHGSAVNRSARPRKTLVIRLVDSTCRLVPARLPDPALAARFPVDDSGHLAATAFPVVYPSPA
jgi:phytanoyl-CoA hydroxylase